MQPTWASVQKDPPLRLVAAFLSVLIATPLAGCSAFQSDWFTPVRGVVLDSETRQPIAHATVFVDREPPAPANRIPGQAPPRDDRGEQLKTGSDGQFSLRGLDPGSHFFKVAREGYVSATIDPIPYQRPNTPLYSSYEVRVGPAMGEIRLFLTPAAKIQGRVTSEFGQPVKGAYITLYTGVVEDGRTMWQRSTVLPTDENGAYSFPNLAPGVYVVVSDWILDNDPGATRAANCGNTKILPASGFPPAANPGVLDFAAAQPIRLSAGHVATANLKLLHREFQTVTWLHNGELSPRTFRTLRDRNGRNLLLVSRTESHCGRSMPETAEPGPASPPENMLINGRETIHLPDGDYTLLTGTGIAKDKREAQSTSPKLGYYAHLTVAGKPLTLSYPLRPSRSEPAVTFRMQSEGARDKSSAPDSSGSALWLTRADPLPEYARPISLMRSQDNKWVFYLEAGSYWVHAGDLGSDDGQTNTCIVSVSADGADMSKEPLVVGLDGKGPQLQVTTTSHCGILHLNYRSPDSNQEHYGVVRSFHGYLVPTFSSFETVHSFLFEPGRPQETTLSNLSPGHYKFYSSRNEKSFAFRESPIAPPDLGPGQDVWLKAGEKVDLSITDPPDE